MDARHFDALARTVTESGTRRGLLALLAALPLLGGLLALLGVDEAAARKNRRKGRKKPHKRAKRRRQTRKQRKKHQKCKAQSRAKTCANRCGTVKNNCKKNVDCGSCICEPPCDICQTCNDRTGVCEPDPAQQGDACGEPGQVCQADGQCACDASSCASCETCQDDGTCSLPCDGVGCCAGNACEDGDTDAACGRDGQMCEACTGVGSTCGGGGQAGVCGCTPTTCAEQGAECGTINDGCGGTIDCGGCSNPTPVCEQGACVVCTDDGQCGAGARCCNGSCVVGVCCTNADCSGTTPVCDGGSCVACQTHAECGDGFLCLADGACQACDVVCAAADHTCDGAALQTAMNAGETVYVCPGRYTGTYVLLGQADVTVIGAGHGDDETTSTILDAQKGGRVIDIAPGRTIALRDLHITGGFTTSVNGGAGIWHLGSLLTMHDCVVSHNETLVNHFVAARGAIFNGGVSQMKMTRCTIRDNSVTNTNVDPLAGAVGGGVVNNNKLEMTDCVIRNNTAKTFGGGLFNNAGTTKLTNCRITGNTLTDPGSGGGIAVRDGTVTLDNTFVWDNTEPECFGTVEGAGCGEAPPPD